MLTSVEITQQRPMLEGTINSLGSPNPVLTPTVIAFMNAKDQEEMEEVIPQANNDGLEREQESILETKAQRGQTEQQSMMVDSINHTVTLPSQTEREAQLLITTTIGEPNITIVVIHEP